MINFIVVNCYTKSHEQAALRLIESLKKFYPENYYTEMYSSRGHWLKNCLYKSVFIKEQLIKFKKPVLWLDADSVILKKLTVIENFDTSIDVGMYFLDKVTPTRIKKLATTNTVYLNYNDKVLFFVDKWIEYNNFVYNNFINKRSDQDGMIVMLKKEKFDINIHHLPLSYAKPKNGVYKKGFYNSKEFLSTDPVIEQYQISHTLNKNNC